MTRDELRTRATRALGEQWQTPLARLLGVNPRSVRKLASGERPISPTMEREIVTALGTPRRTLRDYAQAVTDAYLDPHSGDEELHAAIRAMHSHMKARHP